LNPKLPRYPIYIPSKGRAKTSLTVKFLRQEGIPFRVVVEPQEQAEYAAVAGKERILILPWQGGDENRKAFCAERQIEDGGLIAARNWIKEHSIGEGYLRHWQLDDNIHYIYRRWKGKRIYCDTGPAFAAIEDFIDRYENVAIAGLNYDFFVPEGKQAYPPFYLNCRVYSCSLILNQLPYRWRSRYNDDTDICLQVLAGGWCTVLFNVFLTHKAWTMHVPGGNTADLYQGDGRLKMARSMERLWPGVVKVGRRFKRPQHIVFDAWKRFDTQLILKQGINLGMKQPDEYGLELTQIAPTIRSKRLKELLQERNLRSE